MSEILIEVKSKEKKNFKNDKDSFRSANFRATQEKILSPQEKLKQKFQSLAKPQRTIASKKRRGIFEKLGKNWADNTRQKRVIKKAKKEIEELKKKAEQIECFKKESSYKPKKLKKKRVNWYQITPRARKKKRLLAERARKKKLFRFALFIRIFGKPADINNTLILKAFLTKFGKIKSRRKTRISPQDQRKVSNLIKKARSFQLIPCLSLVKFGVFKKFRKKAKRYSKYSGKTSWKSTPKVAEKIL